MDKMYKTTQKLLDYLELRDVRIQVPTPVLISKFIVLLNLPGTEVLIKPLLLAMNAIQFILWSLAVSCLAKVHFSDHILPSIPSILYLFELTAELHGFCQRLHMMRVEKIKEQEGIEICESNEVLAMMCIITTLQLMLGLNDRMEW